jgi:hypothetical protein
MLNMEPLANCEDDLLPHGWHVVHAILRWKASRVTLHLPQLGLSHHVHAERGDVEQRDSLVCVSRSRLYVVQGGQVRRDYEAYLRTAMRPLN